MTTRGTTSYKSQTPGHPWLIAGGVVGFLLFTVAAMGGLYLFYLPAAHKEHFKITQFSPPRLQIDPSRDLDQVDRQQRARLNETKWLDNGKTKLAIPIGAAMKVVEGLGPKAYAPLPNAPQGAAGGRPPGAMAPGGRRFNPGAGQADQMRGAK